MENMRSVPSDCGILSFNVASVRHDYLKVWRAFHDVGFGKVCPGEPEDVSAFLDAVSVIDERGKNPKPHGNKQPLFPGYRVSFKKVLQLQGKTEIIVNVNVLRADKRGEDAPCWQVISWRSRNIHFSKPDHLPVSQYNPGFMEKEFLDCFAECRKIDAEEVRASILAIAPKINPLWYNGRTDCFFDIRAKETAHKIKKILCALGHRCDLFQLPVAENRENLTEAFVRSVAQQVQEKIKIINDSLDSSRDLREKTFVGFGKSLDELKNSIQYYQAVIGVAGSAIDGYLQQVNSIEDKILKRMTGSLNPVKNDVPVNAEDPFQAMAS